MISALILFSAVSMGAQPPTAQAPQPPAVALPSVTVVAQKEPTDAQRLPVSVTAVTDWLGFGDLRFVSDAALFSPNAFYSDFTARKLTNPRFRGIGSSPANPAITTFVDGVPHLNTNSSSMELLDVEQVEFARGPQSSLFGRNTLGGLVNVLSVRPSLSRWTGGLSVPLGDYDTRELRGNVSGPLSDRVAVSFSVGHGERSTRRTSPSVTTSPADASSRARAASGAVRSSTTQSPSSRQREPVTPRAQSPGAVPLWMQRPALQSASDSQPTRGRGPRDLSAARATIDA